MTTTELLFGTELKSVSLKGLNKRTGIPVRTLHSWKEDPTKIPLAKLRKIVRAIDLTDEEIVKLIRGK